MTLRRYPSLAVLAIVLLLAASIAAPPEVSRAGDLAGRARSQTAQIAPAVAPRLTLAVDKPSAPFGALITLQITYTNIGLQWTTVAITPANRLAFDPPRSMPCKYDQDASQCHELTLRAIGPGLATIRASAYGEIFDDGCQCWRFSGASDDGPATVVVGAPPARVFLPIARR